MFFVLSCFWKCFSIIIFKWSCLMTEGRKVTEERLVARKQPEYRKLMGLSHGVTHIMWKQLFCLKGSLQFQSVSKPPWGLLSPVSPNSSHNLQQQHSPPPLSALGFSVQCTEGVFRQLKIRLWMIGWINCILRLCSCSATTLQTEAVACNLTATPSACF